VATIEDLSEEQLEGLREGYRERAEGVLDRLKRRPGALERGG
jgi:hypothetical protein